MEGLFHLPKDNINVLSTVSGTVNIDGLGEVDMEGLFALPKEYWTEDIKEAFKFLEEQVV